MEVRKDASHLVDHYDSWKRRTRIAAALREGILAPYWDDLTQFLARRGHSWHSVRRVIEIAKPFAAHAKAAGIAHARELNEALIDDYLKVRKLRESRTCLQCLMLFLREHGIVKDVQRKVPVKPVSPIVEEYRQFLQNHRGIRRETSDQHQRYVEPLLEVLGKDSFQNLTSTVIQQLITDYAQRLTRPQRKVLCARSVRSFVSSTCADIHRWSLRRPFLLFRASSLTGCRLPSAMTPSKEFWPPLTDRPLSGDVITPCCSSLPPTGCALVSSVLFALRTSTGIAKSCAFPVPKEDEMYYFLCCPLSAKPSSTTFAMVGQSDGRSVSYSFVSAHRSGLWVAISSTSSSLTPGKLACSCHLLDRTRGDTPARPDYSRRGSP